MANVTGLDELEDLEEAFDEYADGRGPDTIDGSIPAALTRIFSKEVLPATRRRARQHVGEYADDIDARPQGWSGNNFRYGLGSDSVVVDAHEYGSGQYNLGGQGSTDAETFGRRVGYRIPAETDSGPITIQSNGREQVVEYVVHPGVKPKQFMERTVQEKSDDIAEEVADELVESLADQIDI